VSCLRLLGVLGRACEDLQAEAAALLADWPEKETAPMREATVCRSLAVKHPATDRSAPSPESVAVCARPRRGFSCRYPYRCARVKRDQDEADLGSWMIEGGVIAYLWEP
jgi:hypothetical protein